MKSKIIEKKVEPERFAVGQLVIHSNTNWYMVVMISSFLNESQKTFMGTVVHTSALCPYSIGAHEKWAMPEFVKFNDTLELSN